MKAIMYVNFETLDFKRTSLLTHLEKMHNNEQIIVKRLQLIFIIYLIYH